MSEAFVCASWRRVAQRGAALLLALSAVLLSSGRAGATSSAPGTPTTGLQPAQSPSQGERRLLVLPFVGPAFYEGNPAFRLGLLLGPQLGRISVNGELSAAAASGGRVLAAAISPLFHTTFNQQRELVVGPKLAWFRGYETGRMNGEIISQDAVTGYAFGVNGGIFFKVSPGFSAGGLVDFDLMAIRSRCGGPVGGAEVCYEPSKRRLAVVGVAFAALF